MNYLKLCQELCREAGISSVALSDVTGHDGDFERVVAWVAQAWNELQIHREDWWWMRGEFTLNTVIGDNSYSAADCTPAVTDLSEWEPDSFKIYSQDDGRAFEGTLSFMAFAEWDLTSNVGILGPGRPTRFTIKPDMSLAFNAVPDKIYVVTGRYARAVTELTTKTDIPALPVQFHPAIVYLALQKYAAYEAAGEVYAYALDRYNYYLTRIERNQLNPITFGGPLA